MARLVIGTDKTATTPVFIKEVPPYVKYPLLSRVKDDNNVEIGTVAGYHKDANNVEYAVIVLDGNNRATQKQCLSGNVEITGLPLVGDFSFWENKDTATENCDKIMNFVGSTEYTSEAVAFCRSKSFVIGGVTYYGQLPTVAELTDILRQAIEINALDPTPTMYPDVSIPSSTTNKKDIWSSNQLSPAMNWKINGSGGIVGYQKTYRYFVVPVLEIPNV